MDQLVPKFKKAGMFSKLDIKDAFHQIELKEESRNITTFITSRGLYRYKRLMFGISCAPEHFQKTLERILLPCDGVVNFIDDIIVYGVNDVEHNTRLKKVLDVLTQNDILLNRNKCVFNVKTIQFLGHELSASGIKPLDKYVKVVEDFREPTTIEEVQSFLGLINYVNKWIPDMSTKSEPIRRLLTLKLDNGKQFVSTEFKSFCDEMGIKIYNTTPYSPQQNGEVERQNRDILKRIKISQSEKSDWYKDLLLYLTMYSTPHSTTGKTPSELFFGRLFRDKIPCIAGIENQFDLEVRDHDKIMKEKGKIIADRKRKAEVTDIGIGEKLYVKNMVKENKLTTEFNPVPHTVLSSKRNECNVRNDETGREFRRNVIHLKRVEGNWKVCESKDDTLSTDNEELMIPE
ncbi:uncharacterized protein LOC126380872 [Pectinophora gossypiella]|uniref:uncharacterized protein LOC126380872 n=1 Tax=Pectinophora gossypiella TaxID=13191 RepID=UPI00214E49B1|nr:uncharacterized protein LOC126380872 [Pectinophora gossypiella]